MKSRWFLITALLPLCMIQSVQADDFSYTAIAKRFSDTKLDAKSVEAAKMHGECMIGLKKLIFIKRDSFDPVAEWINFRTISLLEQFPPCNVLIMMQVARAELMGEARHADNQNSTK
ncbi:MAG: hypothetical protein AB8G18_06260 [Gammaproteobacteria bacterium]